MRKAILLASMLVALVGLASLRLPVSHAISNSNTLTGSGRGTSLQTTFPPKITKAAFEKKDLIVEGENFAAGAKILLNGTKPLKTQNDDATPNTRLIVKKASKTLPEEEVVSLQVKNPDGLVSDAIGFFTGLTLTFHNTPQNSGNFLQVGQIFLVNFDDPEIGWHIAFFAHEEILEAVNFKVPLLPNAQRLIRAKQRGGAIIYMEGTPLGGPGFFWQVNLDVQ